jgi:molybdopterin molybdotransferase
MGGAWGKEPHDLLSLEEAWAVVAGEVRPIGTEVVRLAEAGGRVLAAAVRVDEDYPAFDKAMMDGFAVRSADCAAPGAWLRVLGLSAAGGAAAPGVGAGEAVRVNTGAPVPPGADAVVRVEDTQPSEDGGRVRVGTGVRAEQNISRRGSDRRQGETVLVPPIRLAAAHLAAGATAGADRLEVARRVGVAIVPTGDELVEAGQARAPGQIYESNGVMLAALMRQFGAEPRQMGIVGDSRERLAAVLGEAMREPVVISVGGMSMGTLDLVPEVLSALGVRWRFHGVEVRPGKPVAYGRGPDGQHVFGLPGNPASAFVCAWLFVRMAVRGMQGLGAAPPPRERAILRGELKAARDGRPAFVPARVWLEEDGGWAVEACRWSGSGDPFGLALANALLVRREPTRAAASGSPVEVIRTSH